MIHLETHKSIFHSGCTIESYLLQQPKKKCEGKREGLRKPASQVQMNDSISYTSMETGQHKHKSERIPEARQHTIKGTKHKRNTQKYE